MEWMYKNSVEGVDKEEYLLGKAIDKNFETQLSGSFNEVDKDITPASIFSNSSGNLQVDVARKIKEDPLEQIRQKELETRKQLLKNPVKLKKLQNMLKADRDKQEIILKKKAKKKRKSLEIDQLLTSKFLQLKEKLGGKNLVDVGKRECNEFKDKKRSSEREIKGNKKRKKKKKRSPSKSSSEHSSSYSEDEKHGNSSTKKLAYRDEYKTNKKKYGLELRGGESERRSFEVNKGSSANNFDREVKLASMAKNHMARPFKKKTLTEKEKLERLKEMSENATWRNNLATNSKKRYKEEKRKETESSHKSFDEGFFRRQMALAASGSSVQQRIKSNVNNIQRSERDMNEKFARR